MQRSKYPNSEKNETIAALHSLYENSWIEEQALVELTQAYWFLRNTEHRMQMVDDGQIHILPDTMDGLQRISLMSGEANVDNFSNSIRSTLEMVEKHYSELFETATDLGSKDGNLVFTGDDDDPETLNNLAKMGFETT